MKPDDWKEDPVRVWTRRLWLTLMMATVLILWFVGVVKFIEWTLV